MERGLRLGRGKKEEGGGERKDSLGCLGKIFEGEEEGVAKLPSPPLWLCGV